MKQIMIIEDDKTIREELSAVLQANGFDTVLVTEYEQVLDIVKMHTPHLILLDINLPGEDGYKLCTQIRTFSSVPIIFVTSRNSDMDELNGIMMGGDDFITKPYNVSILLARINALLKRTYHDTSNDCITYKEVTLYIDAGKAEHNGKTIDLTRNELKILAYLFRHRGKIVARADLVEYLWDHQMYIDDNALSVHITRLRGKLKNIGVEHFIATKHRQGYMI